MAKFIDIDRLKAEIEKRIKSAESCPFIEAEFGAEMRREGKIQTYNEILSFIDSLPEEPKDLGTLISEAQIVAKRLIDHQNFYQSLPKELQNKHTDIEWRKILEFIATYVSPDSQPEEKTSQNVEEAVKEYFQGYWPGIETTEQCNTDMHFTPPAIMRLAQHFYELGKQSNHTADGKVEEAAEEYRRESFKKSVMPQIDGPANEYGGSIKDAFIAGAEWQKKQMMKDAVDGIITTQNLNRYILVPNLDESLTYGNKVKIIILKDDGKVS